MNTNKQAIQALEDNEYEKSTNGPSIDNVSSNE